MMKEIAILGRRSKVAKIKVKDDSSAVTTKSFQIQDSKVTYCQALLNVFIQSDMLKVLFIYAIIHVSFPSNLEIIRFDLKG